MRKGSKHTEASRLKISQAQEGRILSDEHRLALYSAWRGQHHSDASKHKIGIANTIPIDKETLRRLYVEDKLTIKLVALSMGVSSATIHRNLRLLGIVRSNSEARRLSHPPRIVFYLARKMPDHPRANGRGYVKEHVLVWEEAHRQELPDGWVIHHLNGIKNDNRPENLSAMPNGNHCSGLLNAELRRRIRELEKG